MHPMSSSKLDDVVLPLVSIVLINRDQAINLCVGSEMVSALKSKNHPRMVFCSSNAPSALSLSAAINSLLGNGSPECSGWAMAKSVAHSICSKLSVAGKSTVNPIVSSSTHR